MSLETLRTVLTIVYPLAGLALLFVALFYIGLIRRWWW